MDQFGISVKGVLEVGGKLLLRRNERNEYELLGGKLEKGDPSPEYRLIAEFREESGIEIEVSEQREPWLYEVGSRSIIIVPFVCKALHVPDVLTDADGGTLHWLRPQDVVTAPMPQGYKDSIRGEIPHRSRSLAASSHFRIIPGYAEADYHVEISVWENGARRLHAPLPRCHSPRDLIYDKLGTKNIALVPGPIGIDRARNTIMLNYRIQR